MANNPPLGDSARRGAVRDRSRAFNPQNQVWTKRDTGTGRFMDQKKDGAPFKGQGRAQDRWMEPRPSLFQ
jgi:hypothetical protein